MTALLPGFAYQHVDVNGVAINYARFPVSRAPDGPRPTDGDDRSASGGRHLDPVPAA